MTIGESPRARSRAAAGSLPGESRPGFAVLVQQGGAPYCWSCRTCGHIGNPLDSSLCRACGVDAAPASGSSHEQLVHSAAARSQPGTVTGGELVLSLFPGADLLGRGFAAAGFSVVRGPDLILDERIEDFHVPAGRFDGVIGGPPCVHYSDANRRRDTDEGDRLVLEFLRLIDESRPQWWLMENVRNVPDVAIDGYHVQRLDLDARECGCPQRRLRHLQFGSLSGDIIRPVRTPTSRRVTPTVMTRPRSQHDRPARRKRAQGCAALRLSAFTAAARSRLIGNGVPIPMAIVLAEAVASRGPVTASDCICLCGRPVSGQARQATPACRKRMERRRRGHTRTLHYDAAAASR